MKIIRNKIIPIKGFRAINLFGILFVRGNAEINDVVLNHERIHTAQMKEMLYIPFYVWYVIEWLIRLIIDRKTAYRSISFEKEAYQNQHNLSYLMDRKRFSFLRYIAYSGKS